jgi:hypothetical protein
MKKKEDKNRPTIFDQADLSAFISLYQKIQPRPFLRESDKRVCFEFTEDVTPSIRAFYENVNVPIADYVKVLKHIRSAIFSLKGGAGHDK